MAFGSADRPSICSYQPGGSSGFNAKKDPLSDKDACLRDAALMQNLGVCLRLPSYSGRLAA